MLGFVTSLYQSVFARRVFYPFNKLLYLLSLRGLGVLNFESDKLSGERFFLSYALRVDGVIDGGG